MTIRDLTTNFARYNYWANERLTSWLKSLDRNIIYQPTGSSFGTIDRTLQHILSAQIYWHSLIVKGKVLEFDAPLRENAFEDIVRDVLATSSDFLGAVSVMTEQQVTEFIGATDSFQSRYEYILHVVNHSSYHRGQIVTMARALGVTTKIPSTDYDAFLWYVENKG